ncbi:MAG: D-alanyl-D-alanine carboxypeptidase/D-alanyl-D-alanine-endopeptidase [Acidobacteriota bacterium]
MRYRHPFYVLLILLLLPSAVADAQSPLATLKRAVNEQVSAARQVAPELGVHVVEVSSGDEIYGYNADTPRIIASNAKLFTSAAALDRLGPGFFFETPVRVRGETVSGVLRGDLGVVGGGDPNISGRQYNGDPFGAFREWAEKLRRLGIRRISGEIFLATGLFDDEWVHPDWPRDQLDRWYQAPVASLSFNDNCVLVKVEPGAGRGRVGLVPELPIYRIEGRVAVTRKANQQSVSIGRWAQAPDPGQRDAFRVGGRIHWRSLQVDKWVTVPDPVRYFGSALRQALEEEGIVVEGKVVPVERLPGGGWRTVTIHRTDLITTLEVINKRSQNFYSESLVKLLGARLCDDGTWEGGLRAVRDFLDGVGIPEGYRLADGSGMSRKNRAAPSHLTSLLRHMFFHRWGPEFIRTLPYSGEVDLRWRDRLAEPPYRGNVLAKTGTLNRVSTLSGYAKAKSGKIYAFSILCNASRVNWRAKAAQDRILRALIDHG